MTYFAITKYCRYGFFISFIKIKTIHLVLNYEQGKMVMNNHKNLLYF